MGEYRFQVGMFCSCCQGRNYWLAEKEITSIGCQDLMEQAYQAIELFSDGVILSKGQESSNLFDSDDEGPKLDKPQVCPIDEDFEFPGGPNSVSRQESFQSQPLRHQTLLMSTDHITEVADDDEDLMSSYDQT
jgi:hypothetical protein